MLSIFGHLLASTLPGRRIVSAVLLAAYVVTAAGVPVPIGAKPQAGGEAFPCAACGCGCGSAEQCWRSCCCHSLAERVAWAREHNVRPPEYAVAEAQQAGIDLAWLGVKPTAGAGAPRLAKTGVSTTTACCNGVAVQVPLKALPSCCHSKQSCCNHSHDESLAAKAPSPYALPKGECSKQVDHIVAWRALACHGQSLNWLAAVPTLIVARPAFSHDLPLVAWLGPAVSETAESAFSCPDVPPPERA